MGPLDWGAARLHFGILYRTSHTQPWYPAHVIFLLGAFDELQYYEAEAKDALDGVLLQWVDARNIVASAF